MRKKLKACALLVSASLLASCVYDVAPLVAQAEEQVVTDVTVTGNDSSANTVTSGDGETAKLPEGAVQVYGKDITFNSASTWDDQGEHNFALTTEEALNEGAYVTMDVLIPEEASFSGTIKVQGVARLGSNWSWTEASKIPELTIDDFGEAEDGYRSASIRFDFGAAIEADVLAQFTIKLAGYQCDYSGSVYAANVKLYDGAENTDEEGGVAAEVLVAELADRQQVYGKDITFDSASTWDDQGEYNIALTTTEALNEGAYVTMDVLVPEAASYSGIIKVQGVARIGSNWTWTEASKIPELTVDDFGEAEDGYRSASIRFDFGAGVEADALAQFTIKLAGYQCDYSGPVYIENIKLYDMQSSGGSTVLPEMDPTVIDDFEDGTCTDWANGGSWQYDNGIANSVVTYNDSKMMKVDLDYTGMGSYTWSEAKLENKFTEAYDISAYNLLTFEYYYPADLYSCKVKLFSNSGINSEAEIIEAATLADGYTKATVQVKFSPSADGLADLTIGFVGDSTEYVGSVYVDNITLSQYDANGDFVEITSKPGSGATADISDAPSSVKLADANADDSATALYAYLISLKENDQVLFGHENDINKMVSSTATEGDVKEITGSLSGIYGIDSLSLTGAELGLTDADEALETAIANSVKAAEGGSIISLSAHMPNFTNKKITTNTDGSYNFTACDFSESKDLSNNSAELILPGGEYNDRFTAYLDIIAEYAKALQEKDIPILFRPYHENTGSWFWWGSATSVENYKSLWRYTQEYLQGQGVHNMIYVYSPNGPLTSEDDYMERYPGDEYVDVLAFDFYDDYNTYPATYDDSFFTDLKTTCQVVSALAEKKGKIAAISETGVRVMKKDGSDNEGLLVAGNPVAGQNWYQQVSDIAAECDMPYWLIWANFGDTNFYVPYKYSDTLGHEMINEFIDFYNSDNAIFGNGTNFYGKMGTVTGTAYTSAQGYLIAPFELATIKEATTFRASVKNAASVSFVVTNPDNGLKITLAANKVADSTVSEYAAEFTTDMLTEIGKTDIATVALVADDTVLATVKNISLGKDKDKAAANVIENFDFYAGSDGLLQSSYVENSAGGCSSSFTLSTDKKSDGSFGGAFNYSLNTAKSEVWTGQIKTLEKNDFSAYNAITMWVQPDGMAQKVVIQVADSSGEEFEVYLTDFAKGTEASYVTIPFSSFVGKQNGTLNTAEITKFAIWCNSIIPDGHTGNWTVDSVLYFDGIEAFTADDELLAQVDENGLIFTDESPIAKEDTSDNGGNSGDSDSSDNSSDDSSSDDSSSDSGSSATEEKTLDWTEVQNKVTETANNNAENVNMNFVSTGETKVPVSVLNSIKGTNVTVAFHSGNGVALSISGQDLKNVDLTKIANVDLTVNGNASNIPESAVAAKAAVASRQISVRDTGSFNVAVNMHVGLGKENAGKYANLYRYNATTGQLEYCGSFQITKSGQAMFALSRGGEYLVTVTNEKVRETVLFVGDAYIVQKGDCLSKIARRYNVSLAVLIKNNPQLTDINMIRPGQKLRVR